MLRLYSNMETKEMDKIPKGWKKYRFTDIADIIGGGTPSKKIPEYWNGDIDWLTVNDFNHGRKYVYSASEKITKLGLEKSSTKLLEKGQIIISARGTVGVIAMLGKDMAFNQSNYGINAKKNISFNDFIYYLLKYKINELKQVSYGAVFDTITKSTFENLEIEIPESLEEQKAIASVLSSLDDKIDLLHRQNKTLEQMAETLFRKWFIEEAKEDWEEGKLGEVVTVKGGSTPSTKNPTFWNGNIHWTTPKDLSSNNSIFLMSTSRTITSEGLKKITSGLLPKGTLLLSSRAPVGYLAFTEIPVAINQGYIAIIDNKGVSKYWIYLWLKENMEYVKSHANGSTFQEISKSAFRNLKITIPPKNLLVKFDQIVISFFDKIKSNMYQIRTLERFRDILLPKLMSGEVRVKCQEKRKLI